MQELEDLLYDIEKDNPYRDIVIDNVKLMSTTEIKELTKLIREAYQRQHDEQN